MQIYQLMLMGTPVVSKYFVMQIFADILGSYVSWGRVGPLHFKAGVINLLIFVTFKVDL